MPIYEYQCTKCDHRLEALQKMSEAPLVVCPSCAKRGLVKLVSAASFRLKGGGWYETDFKTGNKKQLAESESAAPSAGKSEPASSKTDAKAAPAKETASKPEKDSKKPSKKAASS